MHCDLSTFPSLSDLPPDAIAAESERIAMIVRLAEKKTEEEIEEERIQRLAPRIIADYLVFMKKADIREKYGIGFPKLKRVIEAGTTEKQREAWWRFDHNRRERERAAVIRSRRERAWTIIPMGKYKSIREAAIAVGIPEQTARNYYRDGIPPEKWRDIKLRKKTFRGRKDYCKPIGEFKSIRAAARAIGIPPTTARKLIRQGITDPTQWRKPKVEK